MFRNKKGFSNITINGQTIRCSGNNVVINNGKVIVDGNVIQGSIGGDIHVEIHGDVNSIDCAGSVTVHGNAGTIKCGGSCDVDGDVSGNVNAGGSIDCGNVVGDINAGGSVRCRKS